MSGFSGFTDTDSKWIHDVFLNFRGEDTRRNFISHLKSFLSNSGVRTFIDDEMLERGGFINKKILRAIEGSQISIVVFSERYAESSWCLDELAKIMECHRYLGQVVLPVFYYVDPSVVRHQKGTFGEAFEKLPEIFTKMNDSVPRWKRALTDAANLSGWDVRNYRTESDVIKELVDEVLIRLDKTYLSFTDFPVGVEPRVQDVIQFLESQPRRACIVGIWGMGGIGKTTIAKAIYNQIRREFSHKSFLVNIREAWEKDRGQIDLLEQLLSDILKRRNFKIHSIEWGKTMVKESLYEKTVLVVLDDVNKFEQLNALCGKHEWFGPGSVIIVTTRDERLLNILKVDYVYRMKEMDGNESLELFSWHAFGKESPREDFIELSRNVVAYCGGMPLALEVLGSCLYERTEKQWRSVLSKLERIPNNQVQEKLKISFDGLDDPMEKDIFLDICCFFIGKDRAYVTEILNGCGLDAEIGITVLIERSLVKIVKNNKLGMHDLLRDMGREIIRESSPEKPEKRSRLWFHKDILEVLRENTGTEDVKGLALKLQRTCRVRFNTNPFKEMKRLRLLQLDHVQLTGDYGYLSQQLRWINWQGFPLRYMPENFYQQNLVAVDLKHSNLKHLWKKAQMLMMLKILNLSHSKYLVNTPDFSNLPNLEQLILKDCPNLSNVHESIGDLKNLVLINFKDCTSLSNLPRMIYKLKSLKTLILYGCSKINKLEEDIEQMESLTALIAKKTAITKVPLSILRSKSIGYISLCEYEGLSDDVFPSIIWSYMSLTRNPLSHPHPFGDMSSSLVSIHVQNNTLGDLSSMLCSLSNLRSVCVECCSEFQLTQELRRIMDRRIMDDIYDANFIELETSDASQMLEHSLKSLLIGMGSYHQVLSALSDSISQGLTTIESGDFFLPGDNHPYWLTHIGEGHSVLFKVPQDSDCRMKGITLCVIYSSPMLESMAAEYLIGVLIVNFTKCTIQLYKRDIVMSLNEEEGQGIISNLEPGDKVEIFVAFGLGFTVKKTAVYLIYGGSNDMKMEPSPEQKNNAFTRPTKRMRIFKLEQE